MDIQTRQTVQSPPALTSVQNISLFALRVVIGWHFLYEGLIKILDNNWTSAGYLIESRWIFSGLFTWIAQHPTILFISDILNIWGLTLIGLGLIFGCFTNLASIAGIALLFLYYIVIPPFPSITGNLNAEGNYLIVNKNLIEMAALFVLLIFPAAKYYSIDRLLEALRRKQSRENTDNTPDFHTKRFIPDILKSRREMLKSFAAVPVFGAFIISVIRRHGWQSFEERQLLEMVGGRADAVTSATIKTARFSDLENLKGQVPQGRIGNVNISRLVCGGNLISGFAHSRDLIYVSSFLKQYFSDEKVIDTLQICEACGINTAILRTDINTLRVLHKYRKRGGKIQWLAQTYPKEDDLTSNIQIAIDNGAVGAFIQGNIADNLIRSHRLDLVEKVISYIKSRGVIAGIAGHNLMVPVTIENAGIDVDFYMKTLHCEDYWSFQPDDPPIEVIDNKLDNYWCSDPEKTIAFMQEVKKPWIAYKVLAAGAIDPRVGLQYTFENGADFACVGMFDFQVLDNANVTFDILSRKLARARNWMA